MRVTDFIIMRVPQHRDVNIKHLDDNGVGTKFITRHHITSKTVSNIWDTKKVRFWSGAGSSAKQQCYDVFQSLQKSRARTGCPVIVNTSFNVRGEPIVCTPEDSYRCFMRTEMDFLVLETCVLAKKISRHS